MTMTSCNPLFSAAERIIAYSVFDTLLPARRRPARRDRRDRGGERLMYGALWRVLPGPWWVRVLILLVVFAAVLVALRALGVPVHRPVRRPDRCRRSRPSSHDAHPRHRQLRQLRLHAQRLPAAARRRDRGGAQRRLRRRRTSAGAHRRVRRRAAVAGAGHARGGRRQHPDRAARRSRRHRRCSASASGTRRSPRRSARRSPTPTSSCTARPR